MKVVHIITALHAEGAQMMLYNLLCRMERSRFDSAVISLSNRGRMADKLAGITVPVYPINMKPGLPTPAAVLRLIRKIRQIKPDVIQGWMYHGNLAAQLGAALGPLRVPVLWNIRGSHYVLKDEKPLTAATIWVNAKLSGLPAKIINNSAASALGHEQKLGYRPDKRVVIPNGFDTSTFSPSIEARHSVRAELGLANEDLIIGMVARYDPLKDHIGFLNAAALLLKKDPNVHFLLVGRGIDNSNVALSSPIAELGIREQLHLLGERSDIPRLLASLDIATLSSYSEGFPNVVGEAMSCGVPCVVTDVGDSAWLVGNTGLVVPPRDPNALAAAWLELIQMSADNRQKLGQCARQRVLDNFSIDEIARQYEAIYEQVYYRNGRSAAN
jgi:glycosyltransferase involved in cell wall biosynthesis